MISALQTRQLAVEAAAAQLLERGLLPTRLPRVPGIEFGSRYVPADTRTIGGDWYDAFVLPSGRLWLVTGDVAGHGLDSAVIMGRVKSALRSYALTDAGVAEVVRLTDRKVQHFEIGSMVTLVCATSEPPYERFEVCSAGHLPPVLAAPGGPGSLLELPVGPPLGVEPGVARERPRSTCPRRRPGALHRRAGRAARAPPDGPAGAAVRSTYAGHAEDVCRDVMHSLVGSDPTATTSPYSRCAGHPSRSTSSTTSPGSAAPVRRRPRSRRLPCCRA